MSDDIRALLDEARAAIEETGARYALIGGCARNAYAEPRATKDVDFAVEADEATHEALVRALAARGFTCASAVTSPGETLPDLALYRDGAGRRIDLLFAKTAFEESALSRSRVLAPYEGVRVPVVTPEDLIVYKVLAGRTQDVSDIEVVVRTLRIAHTPIDWRYVERWCDEWEVRDRLDRVRATLDSV
jgi:predicted nucleotidyltransferase